jgi:hypothetical protein
MSELKVAKQKQSRLSIPQVIRNIANPKTTGEDRAGTWP